MATAYDTAKPKFNLIDPNGPLGSDGHPVSPVDRNGNPIGYGVYPGAAPAYMQGYNPMSMALDPEIERQLSGINLNTTGLDKYRQEALRTGPSAWANTEMQRQVAEEGAQRQRLSREAAGRTAEGESALAMRGGLTGGARERLQSGATHDYLDMSQNVSRQRGLNQLQIQSNDEQNRISQLGQLPGMENQALQPQFQKLQISGQAKQADINNQIAEAGRRNNYNQDVWGKQMEAWGANRTAQATENAGKK